MEQSAKETVIIVHGTWAGFDPETTKWWQPAGGYPAREGFIDEPDAAPHEGSWQPTGTYPVPQAFIGKLDAALHERGSPARCWAHCGEDHPFFHWTAPASLSNSWIVRRQAAARLGEYVAKLLREGWHCHIVAHSHGGNVVVEALPQLIAVDSNERLRTITTLGTPFIDTMSPMYRQATRTATREIRINRAVIIICSLLLLSAIAVLVVAVHNLNSLDVLGPEFAAMSVALSIVLGPFFLAVLIYSFLKFGWYAPRLKSIDHNARSQDQMSGIPFLAIGSNKDEAWQLLHHMRSLDNPIEVPSTLKDYLRKSFQSQMLMAAETDSILGFKSMKEPRKIMKIFLFFAVALPVIFSSAATWLFIMVGSIKTALASSAATLYFIAMPYLTFLSARKRALAASLAQFDPWYRRFSVPYRKRSAAFFWYGRVIEAIMNVPTQMATYLIRRKAWSVLLQLAMGLEGYRFELPPVERAPDYAPWCAIKYEDIPIAAEQDALATRSDWVRRHLEDVSETFSKMFVTKTDMDSLLETVEADLSLVHAAYYTDDECIARIADWIVGKEKPVTATAPQPGGRSVEFGNLAAIGP
jgi:hypothetical protein